MVLQPLRGLEDKLVASGYNESPNVTRRPWALTKAQGDSFCGSTGGRDWGRSIFSCVVLSALLATNVWGAPGQKSASGRHPEQTVFELAPDISDKVVKHPAEIPKSALDALRDSLNTGTVNCLKSMGITPEHASASWFQASAVHLNGPNEVDLVVFPYVPNPSPTNPAGCMLPANFGLAWVLGPGIATGRYRLLLATGGLRLEVLNSRANRYRDIQVGQPGRMVLYKFSGQQYQAADGKAASR